MDNLIPIINKIQDIFQNVNNDKLNLPQIVVIGSQSSGKSSVLENIVGRDFLPRGSGVVTRCPLILQLINDNSIDIEYGEFLHNPNLKYIDFTEIRNEIIKQTNKLIGNNKGITDKPINLKIYSPHVLNLTLVDLPGITRIPIGDQPKDIEIQIRNMWLTYIKNKNAIILAVTPANMDLTTSDSLQIAKTVDVDCIRTLGVITKIDLMDKGTDAVDILNNKIYPLKLGYIAIINRSQNDINNNKTIKDAIIYENSFFSNNEIYNNVKHLCGTKLLSVKLNNILINHIKLTLPELKLKIKKLVLENEELLKEIGDNTYDNINKDGIILNIVSQFVNEYKDNINGKATIYNGELVGGARIKHIFTSIFHNNIKELNINNITDSDIYTTIKNASGSHAVLFIPDSAFETLIKNQIKILDKPCIDCVQLIFDELLKILLNINLNDLNRFQNFKNIIIEESTKILYKYLPNTKTMVSNIINIESSYINTQHPNFISINQATEQTIIILNHMMDNKTPISNSSSSILKPASESTKQHSLFYSMFYNTKDNNNIKTDKNTTSNIDNFVNDISTSDNNKDKIISSNLSNAEYKSQFEVILLKTLMLSYYDIVKSNILDMVPKTIMYYLVNNSMSILQKELISNIYKYNIDDLLLESIDIVEKRNTIKNMLSLFNKADNLLNNIFD